MSPKPINIVMVQINVVQTRCKKAVFSKVMYPISKK